MKPCSLLLALLLASRVASAQKPLNPTDTTMTLYGPLKTMKMYEGSFEWGPPYKINHREVDKATFDHYRPAEFDITYCTPCILAVYGLDEKILRKSVEFMDTPVGYWIEYFSNGKVKIIGHYRINDTGSWRQLSKKIAGQRVFGQRDGFWTYFDEKGHKLYTETWKGGQFLKQVPEQKRPEVWGVQLLYNGLNAEGKLFSPQQFKELVLVPKFKNSSTTGVTITGKLTVSLTGRHPDTYAGVEQEFDLAEFNKIDVEQMLARVGVPAGKIASGEIWICVDGAYRFDYAIKIQRP